MPSSVVGQDAVKIGKFLGARAEAVAADESDVIAAGKTRLGSSWEVFRTWGEGRRR